MILCNIGSALLNVVVYRALSRLKMSTNKEKEGERKFILECIELYRTLPALWNIKSKEYSNRIKKKEQYDQLLQKYKEKYPDADKQQLVKKFNSLRTNFRKELKRIRDSEKSGAGADDIVEPTLWYFEDMKFLIDQEIPSSSQSTMQLEEGEQEDEVVDNVGDISTINNTPSVSSNFIYSYFIIIQIYVAMKLDPHY